MEHQPPRQAGVFRRLAVNRVSHDRASPVVQMHADLVSPSSVQMAAHQRRNAGGIGRKNLVIRNRGLAARRMDHRHFLPVHRVAANVRENRVLGRLGNTLGHREIQLLHGAALGKLTDQRLMGDVGFGHHQAARGVLVESMNDARPLDAANPRKPPPAMMQQRVDQRAVRIARSRVDDNAMRLVEN